MKCPQEKNLKYSYKLHTVSYTTALPILGWQTSQTSLWAQIWPTYFLMSYLTKIFLPFQKVFLFKDFSLVRMRSCYRNCQQCYPSLPSSQPFPKVSDYSVTREGEKKEHETQLFRVLGIYPRLPNIQGPLVCWLSSFVPQQDSVSSLNYTCLGKGKSFKGMTTGYRMCAFEQMACVGD